MLGIYFSYWTPPTLPVVEGKNIETPATPDDYQMTFKLPTFDDNWENEMMSRSLIYCPSSEEITYLEEWFTPQIEALRLTPLFHERIEEFKILVDLRTALQQPALPFFESFINSYIKDDTHLGISQKERQLYSKGQLHWSSLYTEVKKILENKELQLLHAYRNFRSKAAQSRNVMIKDLCWKFTKSIETQLILATKLPEMMKQQVIDDLRNFVRSSGKQKYDAKRAAICLSDIECAQLIYLLMLEFGKNPKKNQAIGEVILFIMIAQHAAFSGKNLIVEDILDTRVTDVNLQELTIIINGNEINITSGLAEVIKTYIGTCDRVNKRLLLPLLNYDKLEKTITKYSKDFGE